MINKVTIQNDQIMVTLGGTLEKEEIEALRHTVRGHIENGKTTVVIDLSAVEYVDGLGLCLLVNLQKYAREKGGGVIITGLHGLVQDLFTMIRMDKVFEIRAEMGEHAHAR